MKIYREGKIVILRLPKAGHLVKNMENKWIGDTVILSPHNHTLRVKTNVV